MWGTARVKAGRVIAKGGVGPFDSRFLTALRKRECMRCGREVAEMSLVSNSVVARPGRVVLYCIHCRGGVPVAGHGTHKGALNIDRAIVALSEHKCYYTGEILGWLETLVCLRLGYGYFQAVVDFDARRAFCKPSFLPGKHFPYGEETFNDRTGVGNCPECGAAWSNTGYAPPDNSPDSACGHCETPNSLQWHLRATEEEERALLLAD